VLFSAKFYIDGKAKTPPAWHRLIKHK